MSQRPRYLAASRKLGLTAADLTQRAAWLDLEAWTERPLPTHEAGLLLNRKAVRLQVPGGGAGLWPAGLVDRRSERGEDDALVRAVAPQPGQRILDCTFGLGHDALVLARRGARVTCLERDPALLFFSACGLTGHDATAARRLTFCCTDHRDFLARAPAQSFEVVYLDPMFPGGRPGRGPTLEPLRRCAVHDPVEAVTLAEAWRVAARAVVLRLPPRTDPPLVPGLPPPQKVESRRVAFATWTRG